MMFVATLIHSPELCFAKREFAADYKRWVEGMGDAAKKHKVKVHGAYINPNEHTFFFVLEAESLKAISEFLGPQMLTHNDGHICPVMKITETVVLSFMKEVAPTRWE